MSHLVRSIGAKPEVKSQKKGTGYFFRIISDMGSPVAYHGIQSQASQASRKSSLSPFSLDPGRACRASETCTPRPAAWPVTWRPAGLLIVEPWFTPDTWHPGTVHSLFIDEPQLKIARVSTSLTKGRISHFDLHHLVGTPEGTRHFVEHHELGLFRTQEVRDALSEAGFGVRYDEESLTERGLFVARKP